MASHQNRSAPTSKLKGVTTLAKNTSNSFIDSLIVQPVDDYMANGKRIEAQRARLVVREPASNTWVQVHPTHRVFPLATMWNNNRDYLVTNEVAKDLLPNVEYKTAALLLCRDRSNSNVCYLWLRRLQRSGSYEQQLDKLIFPGWGKVDQWGDIHEEQGKPEVRNPFGDLILQRAETPEKPAPWSP